MLELKGKIEPGVEIKAEIIGTGPRGPQGTSGKDGKDGYTPVKGKDYFDGAPGKDGKDGKDATPYDDSKLMEQIGELK